MPFAVLFVIAAASALPAASFDCGKARTRSEKLVCSTPELSKADEVMAAEYARARNAAAALGASEAAAIRDDQIAWLRDRAGACPDAVCLATAYRQRTAALVFYAGQAALSLSDPLNPTGTYEMAQGELKVLALPPGAIKFAVFAQTRITSGTRAGRWRSPATWRSTAIPATRNAASPSASRMSRPRWSRRAPAASG